MLTFYMLNCFEEISFPDTCIALVDKIRNYRGTRLSFLLNATAAVNLATPEATTSMMTFSNGNIFRVTGPLCGECTGHR